MKIDNSRKAAKIITSLLKGSKPAGLAVAFLSENRELVDRKSFPIKTDEGELTFDTKALMRKVLDTKAKFIVVGINTPDGKIVPDKRNDLGWVISLRNTFRTFATELCDVLFFNDEEYYSFADEKSGRIPKAVVKEYMVTLEYDAIRTVKVFAENEYDARELARETGLKALSDFKEISLNTDYIPVEEIER